MSPSWIWSDKITNERVARVGYNHFISNKGEWNNCFSNFSNRVLAPIFISAILQSVRKENLAHYFPYDVKLRLLAHSRSFLANQKARNAIVGAENLLKDIIKFSTSDNAILAFWLVHCISVTTDYTNVLPYMEINAANVIFFVGSQVSSTKKMDETKNKFGELSTKEIQEITDNVVPVTKRP